MKKQRILVYQVGNIGDTIVSLPSLNAVRRHFGELAEICLLHEVRPGIRASPVDILTGGRDVDRFIQYEIGATRLGKIWSAMKLMWRLRSERFAALIYLAPSERTEKQVKRDAFFFRLCGIWRCIGARSLPREALYPIDSGGRPGRVKHEALCRLERLKLDSIDISIESDFSRSFLEIPPSDMDRVQLWLRKERRYPDRALVAICPGSKQPANLWPLDRFTEIGKRLLGTGRYELLVVGGQAEEQVGNNMLEIWGDGVNSAGQFSVLGSAALLAQCVFCIGLDTGTTHIAAALGVRCVALYGERDNPGRFEPLGDKHIVLRIEVPCAGCRVIEARCPVEGHPCMTGISVDAVWAAVQQMEDRIKI
jgi:ADP-heptose:LPS heptosyltransferase